MAEKLNDLTPDPAHARADDASLAATPPDHEAMETLDNLAKEISKGKAEGGAPILDDASAAAAASRAAAAKGAVAPAAPAAPAAGTPEATEAEKAAAEKASQEQQAAAAAEVEAERLRKETEARAAASTDTDPFADIELPAGAKSKSAQAFGQLKEAAKTKVAEVAAALTQAKTELQKVLEENATLRGAQGKLTPELEQELTALRSEHAALDVKNDPEFKKYDTTLQSNADLIYKKLAEGGVDAEAIAKIKEFGGPDSVDWEPILSKLPASTRRFVEATLVDNERVKEAREKAFSAASSNAVEYSKNRHAKEEQHVKEFASGLTKQFEWMQVKDIPATATPQERANLETANADAQNAQNKLTEYLNSRSPERYAELAVGTVLAYKYRAMVEELRKENAALKADTTLATVTKERDELKAKLEAIKRAQIPRNRGDVLTPPAPPKKVDFNSPGTETLDALAKEVVSNRDE